MATFAVAYGALTQVPVYESHKRGKNWMAVIAPDPRSPGGLARTFLPHARGEYYYLIEALKPGDVVEFGADYYTSSGRKSAARWYGVVRNVTEDKVEIEQAPTATQAFKLQREVRSQV